MYEIATEYDGREVVIIKPSIGFQVALAGTIKKDLPKFNELDAIIKEMPMHNGIWIEKNSREKFLQILKQVTASSYIINDEGYLVIEEANNEFDEKIKNILSKENLYIIDICPVCYIIDEVTGEIQEYPFEEMDPYQSFEYFESENKSLFVVTSNTLQKLNYNDIIKEIIDRM